MATLDQIYNDSNDLKLRLDAVKEQIRNFKIKISSIDSQSLVSQLLLELSKLERAISALEKQECKTRGDIIEFKVQEEEKVLIPG